jgi:hypothetical protein
MLIIYIKKIQLFPFQKRTVSTVATDMFGTRERSGGRDGSSQFSSTVVAHALYKQHEVDVYILRRFFS